MSFRRLTKEAIGLIPQSPIGLAAKRIREACSSGLAAKSGQMAGGVISDEVTRAAGDRIKGIQGRWRTNEFLYFGYVMEEIIRA